MSVESTGSTTEQLGPLSRVVAQFGDILARLTAEGKSRVITVADTAPMEEFIAVDEFKRVGLYREEMRWPEYARFLAELASAPPLENTFRRMTETGRLVFFELSERGLQGDRFIDRNTMMVFEFDDKNRISGLHAYQQSER